VRQRVLGGIGVLWGGLILLSRVFGGAPPAGSGAYGAGRNAALVFAVLLFSVGLYYLLRKSSGSR
jgi:hypothetical protein